MRRTMTTPVNGIQIKYYDGFFNKVDESTKTAVDSAIKKAQERIDKNFFKNLNIHIASDFSKLTEDTIGTRALNKLQFILGRAKGCKLEDSLDDIYIQESGFKKVKALNLFKNASFRADNEIEQALMHELGHRFDDVYGNLDPELQKKYLAIMKKSELNLYTEFTKEEEKIIACYESQNGYSDRKEFQEALFEDLQSIKIYDDNNRIWKKYKYFISEFFINSSGKTPTMADIKKADYCRSEMFAQLFSFANGTQTSDKEEFVAMFPKTYEQVLKYIEKHSK